MLFRHFLNNCLVTKLVNKMTSDFHKVRFMSIRELVQIQKIDKKFLIYVSVLVLIFLFLSNPPAYEYGEYVFQKMENKAGIKNSDLGSKKVFGRPYRPKLNIDYFPNEELQKSHLILSHTLVRDYWIFSIFSTAFTTPQTVETHNQPDFKYLGIGGFFFNLEDNYNLEQSAPSLPLLDIEVEIPSRINTRNVEQSKADISVSASSSVDVKKIKQCHGKEPFWNLSINADQLIFDKNGASMVIKNSNPKSAIGISDKHIALYQGKVVGQEKFLNVILKTDSQCIDNMSNKTYAITALVLTGSELYTGCCSE